MKQETVILKKSDFEGFREWISLDLEAITWQGRYSSEFEEFWNLFFVEGLSFRQMMDRFSYASHVVKIGPLSSWFIWLKEKLITYIFIYRRIDLHELCQEGDLDISQVANTLRTFFLEKYPHLDGPFNDVFQVGNILSDNIYISFPMLCEVYPALDGVSGSIDYEVMASMEITLYEEWHSFFEKMKKDLIHPHFNFAKIKSDATFKQQFKFARELLGLIILGILLIYGVKVSNEMYEKHLTNRISIYEPQFMWLDKTLKFKKIAQSELDNANERVLKIDFDQIQTADTDKKESTLNETTTFGTESDVSLTSWDSLPKDFDATELEQSDYEEKRKGGFRDYAFGNRKVFRVIINSVKSQDSRDKLQELLKRYGVTQADNVKPGLAVPGGYYFNLYVNRRLLKEFLANVMEVDDSILYESRTSRRNPPGQNKVFIWVKSL
ncbi:MAG: hypothetical protein KAG61_08040 [Bacteriovoracaceae bacterium]|nr:hypothetical protein [Bacteriovoracaceae bacterium]